MPKPAKVGVTSVDFKPVDLSGLTAEEALKAIGEGMNAIHTCIHMGQEENRRAHDEARAKRHEMTSSFLRLEDTVRDLSQEVGGLKLDRDTTDGYIKKLAEKFGAVEVEHDHHRKKPEPIGTWGWKKASIAGAILIAITTLVTNAAVYAFIKNQATAADDFLTKQAAQSQGQIVEPEKKNHEK